MQVRIEREREERERQQRAREEAMEASHQQIQQSLQEKIDTLSLSVSPLTFLAYPLGNKDTLLSIL